MPENNVGNSGREASRLPARGKTSAFTAVLFLLTLGITVIIVLHAWKIGVNEWRWGFHDQPLPVSFAAPAIFSSILLALLAMLTIRKAISTQREWFLLGALLVAALCLILSAGTLVPYEQVLFVTASPWVGGYYAEASQIEDIGAYLRHYNERITGLSVKGRYGHIADHPVGPVLFHWLVNRAMERFPALAAAFIPDDPEIRIVAQIHTQCILTDAQIAGIWGSALLYRLFLWLALIPVYFLSRSLYSRKTAVLAVGLTAFIPSLHLFGPYPDQVFPLLAVGAVWAWHHAISRRCTVTAICSAMLLFFGLLWSLALAATLAIMLLITALLLWNEFISTGRKLHRRSFLWPVAAWIFSFSALSLLVKAFFGYDVWGVWRICLTNHAMFPGLFGRSYLTWVLFNPIEFAIFLGLPAFLLWAKDAWTNAHRWWADKRVNALSIMPWALTGALLALNFSGKNLGEVARLWMFLMPFATVSAGNALAELDRGRGWLAGCVLLAGAAQLIAFQMHVRVFGLTG